MQPQPAIFEEHEIRRDETIGRQHHGNHEWTIAIYQTDDGQTEIEIRVEQYTLGLTLSQMAELYDRDKSVISRHLKNIFDTGELPREATVAKNATVQTEGGRQVRREIEYFNMDAAISVGYRVNSINRNQSVRIALPFEQPALSITRAN